MGDRANIAVVQHDGSRVWLYTHWDGYDLPEVLRAALDRGRDRWEDAAYLARIIFCQMTKGQEMETTGFGISTRICDNERPVLVVDCERGMVTVERDGREPRVLREIGFAAWCDPATDIRWSVLR